MIPSTEQVAENIKRTVETLAADIGRASVLELARLHQEHGPGAALPLGRVIQVEAQKVLLDWFLGDKLAETTGESEPTVEGESDAAKSD
jgi:hypothetical protein